ncbi:MAG TPA: hypothetical protein VGJ60_07340 [Chloroflexota bacterium]|jgi:hypothetical protein
MPTTANAARGVLAVARAVLAQFPDTTLDDLAAQLASGLGGKRPEMRQVLLDAGLFNVTIPPPDGEREPLPRYVVHFERIKGVQPFVVASTDPPRPIMPFDHLRDAQMVCDGLNLELPIGRALDRARLLDELVHGDGGLIRFDRPIPTNPSKREAFACDLLQPRAWGPFESVDDADLWRERDDRIRVWAVTSHWPFSRYYPPALYGLFRNKEHPLRSQNPWLNKPQEAPKRSETDAKDMTPVILEAVRQYMAFQSETDRMYGPCREAFERLRALLQAGGASESAGQS